MWLPPRLSSYLGSLALARLWKPRSPIARGGSMTMGTSEAQDDLFRSVRELCDGALGERSIYRLLAEQGHLLLLNQVEIWFSILTGKALLCRSFSSLRALDNALYAFAAYWNRDLAHPFKWTYTGRLNA
jgi:hypothetical protein